MASTWKSLTTILESAAGSLSKEERAELLNTWSSRKTEVMKLVTSTPRKEKKERHPDQPKRPLTSYFLFMQDQRPIVRKKHPALKGTEVNTKISELWKTVSTKDKKRYEERALVLKKEWAQKMEEFKTQHPELVPAKKERTGPKHPSSNFIFFRKEHRVLLKEKHPELSEQELMKLVGTEWENVKKSEKERSPYDELARKDRERYEAEKKQAGVVEEPKPVKKNKKAVKEAVPEVKPKVVAKVRLGTVGYDHFCAELRKELESENPSWTPRRMVTELNRRWRALSDTDREAHELEAARSSHDDDNENSEDSDALEEEEENE